MGLKAFIIDFAELITEKGVRNDFKYFDWRKNQKRFFSSKIKLGRSLTNYYKGFAFKGDDFSSNGEVFVLKGVNLNSDYSIDFENIQYLADDFFDDKRYDNFKVKKDDIILSLVGSIGKIALIEDDYKMLLNQNNIALRPNKELFNIKYFAYVVDFLLKEIIKKLYSNSGYSFLRIEDLFDIDLPLVSKPKQDQIVDQIEPIEKKIKELKAQITSPQVVINKVFAREFEFDLDAVNTIERIRYFTIDTDITYRNRNLRSSVRWNKIKPIQQVLYKDNPHIKKLGKFILFTKNGWSPNCKETDTENVVFGVNSISKDGCIKFEDLKYSDEDKNSINDYFTKENDLFVSRGNTVDLVALASIVKNIPDEQNYIFPDLFIRIELDIEQLNKEYLALLFNSIIGRYYFKYSAKGKNQTMVKISSEELSNFYLPVPPIKTQQKIVDEIKTELAKQEEIKRKIKSERNKIDEIVENAVK